MAHTNLSPPQNTSGITGWRAGLDRTYAYLTGLFALGVLAQVFLAGVGVFGDHGRQVADAASFDPHRALGTVLGVVAVVLFVVVALARPGRGAALGALALAVLTLAAQPLLANAGDNDKWVGGFHALDGMLILILSLWVAATAHRRQAARRQAARRRA